MRSYKILAKNFFTALKDIKSLALNNTCLHEDGHDIVQTGSLDIKKNIDYLISLKNSPFLESVEISEKIKTTKFSKEDLGFTSISDKSRNILLRQIYRQHFLTHFKSKTSSKYHTLESFVLNYHSLPPKFVFPFQVECDHIYRMKN